MEKKIVIILIVIILILVAGFLILKIISQPSIDGFGPCRILKPIYTSSYEVTSSENAKMMLTDFFTSENIEFNAKDIKVERIKKYYLFTNYYIVMYHICGTMQDIKNIPTGQAATFSGGTPNCSNIPFRIKDNQIIGQFVNPC